MRQHITRAYNSFSINAQLGTITKTSKETRLADEINYYREINKTATDCALYFPCLLKTEENTEGFSAALEYYAYDNLGDYMVYQEFDRKFWEGVAHATQGALSRFGDYKSEGSPSIAESMYIHKTERYYEDLVKNFDKFRKMAQPESLVINGNRRLNFKGLWKEIVPLIKTSLLNLSQTSLIHGDFCFSNILCGVNKKTATTVVKFVDPRGSFGTPGIYGDYLYDHAKLLHSYEGGYEYIIFDEFSVTEDMSSHHYSIEFANNNKEKIADVFDKTTDFKSYKSKLIEGLIYIGMCSRHYDSEERQTAMYLTGIETLNKVLEGKIK